MVRRGDGGRINYAKLSGQYEDEDEDEYSDEGDGDYDYGSKKKAKKSPAKRTPTSASKGRGRGRPKGSVARKGPRGKISPSKTPASKRKYASQTARSGGRARNNVSYYDDDDEEEEESEEEYDHNTYHRRPVPKSAKRGRYDYDYEEEGEEEEEEEETDSNDSDYSVTRRKPPASSRGRGRPSSKGKARPGPKSAKKRESFPPVKVMVIESIKALKDHPRKGSTLGSIKETISLNWDVNMKLYDHRIKKFITNALATGELTQPKGKGFRGRFSLPGMKLNKRKKKPRIKDPTSDDEELNWKPEPTQRAEEKEKHDRELEQRREERRMWAEEKAIEKMNRPKKSPKKVNKNKEWAVEAIKGKKFIDGKLHYLVKFEGWAKPQYEPEENVDGCIYVEEFEREQARKRMEADERRKREEEEGAYEVRKIVDVKGSGNRREFLVRWVGHGPEDDSWEPEENLDCSDLIDKFLANQEKLYDLGEKRLREAPTKVKRLEYASSKREGKRHGGFRVSYVDMDI